MSTLSAWGCGWVYMVSVMKSYVVRIVHRNPVELKNTLSGSLLMHKMLTVSAMGETLCSKKDKGKLLTGWC